VCQDRITQILDEILSCVTARFDECGTRRFCREGVVAGSVAWDDCCDCGEHDGQLWVRLADWSTDPDFPTVTPDGCSMPTLLSVGVGALRCVPTLDESGRAPTAKAEAAAAALIHSDAQLIFDGVMCCVEEKFWRGWLPLGADGGCGGGEHLFQVPFGPCRCGNTTGST